MRINFGKKSWMYPLPVLIIGTYNSDGTANAMNAAWGGMYDSDKIILCLSAGHKTTSNILERQAFTVSFADAEHVIACDYVGLVSGNKISRKIDKAGFHTIKSEFVDAPLIQELPMTLECQFLKQLEDGNIIGEIVNVSIDENVLGMNKQIDFGKFQAIIYDPIHNEYRKIGKKVGNAFRDGADIE